MQLHHKSSAIASFKNVF